MYAMMHIAIRDALNAIDRKFQPYAYDKKAEPEPRQTPQRRQPRVMYSTRQSANCLLIKKECIDGGTAIVEAAYKIAIDAIPDGSAKTQGIELGQASAAAILSKRADDHASDGPFLNNTTS